MNDVKQAQHVLMSDELPTNMKSENGSQIVLCRVDDAVIVAEHQGLNP